MFRQHTDSIINILSEYSYYLSNQEWTYDDVLMECQCLKRELLKMELIENDIL